MTQSAEELVRMCGFVPTMAVTVCVKHDGPIDDAMKAIKCPVPNNLLSLKVNTQTYLRGLTSAFTAALDKLVPISLKNYKVTINPPEESLSIQESIEKEHHFTARVVHAKTRRCFSHDLANE